MEKKYVIKGHLTATPVDIDKKAELDIWMDMFRKLLKNVPVDAEVVSVGLSPKGGLTLEYRQVVDTTKDENLGLTRDYHSAPIDQLNQLNGSPINWAAKSMIEEANSIRAEASESM